MSIELKPLESLINSWTMIFMPDAKEKFNGKLYVTNTRLVFDMLYNITSFKQVLESAYVAASGENSQLEIPKSDIVKVEIEKSFLQKKVIVTVQNGAHFTFSYGIMNVDAIAEAIKSK